MKDEDFIARVRRHRPSALLPRIAEFASTRQESETWFRPGQRGIGTPWALAEIARVSIAYGNEHRQDANSPDVVACNLAYNDLDDPELVEGYQGPLAGFFLRMSEQLEYQLPALHEMSRSVSLLAHTTPTRLPKVIRPGWDRELFGTDLISFIAAGEMLHTATRPNSGRFNPKWLDQPNFEFVADYINPDHLRAGLDNYVADAATIAASNGRPNPSPWRRLDFNPLLGRPAVRGLHDDLLIPVPALTIRRLSPLGIYYAGIEKWGTDFADDLGDLFENYIGNNLRIQEHGSVEASFTYNIANKESVDYIVTLPEIVVLVEVKSVRPTAAVRAGNEAARGALVRMLGRGIEQLERADELIEQGHPAFAHIPTDRPRVGVLVTMESFHVLNSGFHAPMFKRVRPQLPITIASAGEIEHWVTVNDATPGQVILDALSRAIDHEDTALGFHLKKSLEGRKHRRNPIINASWESGPWQQ